jgi:ferredoxin
VVLSLKHISSLRVLFFNHQPILSFSRSSMGAANRKIICFFNHSLGVKMAYIICEPCVGTCDTACVEVCPVDCIHGPEDKEGAGAEAKADGFDPEGKMLYVDPEECIDCGACEPECPVEAIFEESEVPEEWNSFIKINYDWFGRDYAG